MENFFWRAFTIVLYAAVMYGIVSGLTWFAYSLSDTGLDIFFWSVMAFIVACAIGELLTRRR